MKQGKYRPSELAKGVLPVMRYSSEADIRRPAQFLHAMFRDLFISRGLAWRLWVRNIKARYRQSILGYVWAILPAVFTTLLWVFLNSQDILAVGETDIPYPVYVLVGTLLWQGFVDAVLSPLRLLSTSRAMLAKINFPREAIILAAMGEVLFNFLIRLVLLGAVLIWYGIDITYAFLLTPVGVVGLLSLGLMFGMMLAPWSLLYKDIENAMVIMTTMWMYITPVVYPVPTSGVGALVSTLNPVSPMIVTTREMLTTGQLSCLPEFLVVFAATIVLLFIGWVIYRLSMPYLVERMSA